MNYSDSDNNRIYLENIIERIPYFIFWKSTDLVYLGCNQRFIHLIGKKSHSEVIGKTDFELGWGQGEAELFREGDRAVMDGNPIVNVEETLSRADGSRIVMLVSKVPLRDKYNNCIGILGVSTDITERKEIEEELQISKELAEAANQAKTAFLENMQHDLRTPLTGILGFASILKEEVKDKKLSEYIDNLMASANSLSAFINEILDSIKIASGDVPLMEVKFDLKTKISQIITFLKKKMGEKNIDIIVNIDDKVPEYIVGDSLRIGRIALELIDNAFKFTEHGTVKIDILFEESTPDDPILKVIVADSGIGIPVEKQGEIFEKFNRLTPSYKGMFKGAGLGLSIVKQFVDELHGVISVESEPNKGSTFTCKLPVKTTLSYEAIKTFKIASALSAQIPVKGRDEQINVLLVEDDELAAKVTRIMLKSLSCEVHLAKTGKAALKLAADNTYDIIFMDIGLPDIDGYTITQKIRENEFLSNAKHTPIIALSAHVDMVENKQKCIERGMDAVFRKPLMKYMAQDILRNFTARFSGEPDVEQRLIAIEKPVLDESSNDIINFKKILHILGNNQELAKDMLTIMVDNLAQDVVDFKKAYQEKNWKIIKEMAHKLRGSASYCGTDRLKSACTDLENNIDSGTAKSKDKLFEHLLNEIQMVREEYKKPGLWR